MVLAFVFNTKKTKVLLIHKEKPEWQKGFINGIGGKVEKYETPLDAIVREIYEETGLNLIDQSWKLRSFSSMEGDDWIVHNFVCFSDLIFLAKSNESEKVEIFNYPLSKEIKTIYNLSYLLPLALDEQQRFTSIDYTSNGKVSKNG